MPNSSKKQDFSPFLGVMHSVTKRCWIRSRINEKHVLAMSRKSGFPDLISEILVRRGILDNTIDTYLEPKLKYIFPDPFHLRDMDKAASRLAGAIIHSEIVAILGDYDVDGATSAALMKHFIEAMGGRAILYIPDRIREGYGPNTKALLHLKDAGATVVVTVDCGTSAFIPIASAMAINLDIIVVDHHKPTHQLPTALAIINPNRLDETGSYCYLAAVGVAFLVVVATRKILRESGWCTGNTESLTRLLDLVALGTVCDMVPLIGLNRTLVIQGLKVMQRKDNIGLNALSKISGLHTPVNTEHLLFILGPRINAGGRVGRADLGAKLLSTRDPSEAMALAYLLDNYNRNRQVVEKQVLLDAIEQISYSVQETPIIFVASPNWHPGVIGIVASRLREYYNCLACVLTIEGDLAKGSCRSIADIDIGTSILAAKSIGLLEEGGGHTLAAGFTVQTKKLWILRDFLIDSLGRNCVTRCTPILWLDGIIDPVDAATLLNSFLCRLEPFGPGNPEPHLVITNVRVTQPKIVGSGHILCNLVTNSGSYIKAIAPRTTYSSLRDVLLFEGGAILHVAGILRHDSWRERNVPQFFIEDIAYA